MDRERQSRRLGINVPYEWWPSAPLLKSFEAAGFGWVQVPAPPPSVLVDPSQCHRHAGALAAALDHSGLRSVLHGPGSLRVGSPAADRVLEGALSYAAQAGCELVVYHAANLPDGPETEDALLAETRSLSRLAATAERLEVVIAVENLAPLYPGPEHLGHTPFTLSKLVRKLSSPAVGLCLDVGHAHVVADIKHTDAVELVRPVLGAVVLVHAHDNLGGRRHEEMPPELDPLRLDLHLPPGRGTVPWERLAPMLAAHDAPVLLEVHPPHRPELAELHACTLELALGSREPAAASH